MNTQETDKAIEKLQEQIAKKEKDQQAAQKTQS
jgi:hypothetical protein